MTQNLNIEQFRAILKDALTQDEAAIYGSSVGTNQAIRVITLDLSTAKLSTKPYEIGFPFRSIYVISSTDSSVSVNMKLETQDSFMDSFPIKSQTSLKLPFPVNRAYLDWSAQSGKTIQILFSLRGEFSTNQVASLLTGGLNILDGAVISTKAVAGISITSTASILCSQNSLRILETIQNQDSASIWVGDSSVTDNAGTNPGIEIPAGAYYLYRNTAALYAVSKGTVTKIARKLETNT